MAQSGMEPMTVSIYLRECLALVCGAVGLVTLLAFLSFSPQDLDRLGAGSEVGNLIGSAGVYFSFALFWLLGATAYLLPFATFWLTLQLIRYRDEDIRWGEVSVRLSVACLLFLPLSLFATLHVTTWQTLPLGGGGALGTLVAQLGLISIDKVGSTIVALVLILVGIQLVLGFSWLKVFEWTGKTIFDIANGIKLFSLSTVRLAQSTVGRLKDLRQNRVADTASDRAPKRDWASHEIQRLDPVVPPIVSPTLYDQSTPDFSVDEQTIEDSDDPTTAITETSPERVPRERNILSKLPSIEILTASSVDRVVLAQEKEALIALGERLREILADYRVTIEVESIITGPVVSRFEIQLAPGSKVAKIVNLANDLAREIAVRAVRVVPVIPGKTVVGIEIPNPVRATVRMREILECETFQKASKPLTLALGKSISGEPVYADLERMPHLLVAGTTGSGKSVGVNTMLMSLLYRLTPADVRFIMIDPKMLELSVYEQIPHMLTPVVTDMQDAAKALQWSIGEMERRYRLMKELQVRSLGSLNEKIQESIRAGEPLLDPLWDPLLGEEQGTLDKLPLIVIVIDEFADMIMIVGKKVEQLIARIAQKARAAGIHLILATQRPSVDVITGLIKANIPCRISYQVSSQVDSRTILDQVGAEQLLGNGDMLFLPPGTSVPERVHGAYVTDEEVLSVVEEWRIRGLPDYVNDIMAEAAEVDLSGLGMGLAGEGDDLYTQAVTFVLETKRASASALQTKFQIGWNKAARLMDQMEGEGVVSVPDTNGRRQVLGSEI